MNTKLVGALASLLEKEPNVIVEALEKEDGDDVLIADFTKARKILTAEQEAKLLTNRDSTFIERHLSDWKENGFPKELHTPIKLAVLSAKEREFQKKYGIEGDTLDAMFEAANKSKPGKADPDPQLQAEIDQLKTALKTKAEEYEAALTEANTKANNYLTSRDFEDALKQLPLDYSAEALPKQLDLIRGIFNTKFGLRADDGKTLVVDKDGQIVKDQKVYDPLPLDNVLQEIVTDYDFKIKQQDPGGRGFMGSKGKTGLAGLDSQGFDAMLAERGIHATSPEGEKLFTEWKAANPQ